MQSMQEVLSSYVQELSQLIDFEIKGKDRPSPQEQVAKAKFSELRKNITDLLAKNLQAGDSPEVIAAKHVAKDREYVDLFKSTQDVMRQFTDVTYTLITRTTTSGIFSSATVERTTEKLSPLSSIVNRIISDMEHRNSVLIITAEFKRKEAELKAASDEFGATNQKAFAALQQTLSLQETQATTALRVLAGLLSNMPADTKKAMHQHLKEVKLETTDGTTTVTLKSEEPAKFGDNSNFDPRYASNIVPVLNLVEKRPLEGALSCFSYVMSPRRAVAAAILFRYLMKLNNLAEGCSTKHPFEYSRERLAVSQKVNMKEYISACLLYLFLEVDKSWDEIIKDPHNPAGRLLVVAQQKTLGKILSKLERITDTKKDQKVVVFSEPSKPKVELGSLSDKSEVWEEGKTVLSFTAKYASMFFNHNPILKTEKYGRYLEKYYRPKAGADQLASKHDYEALHTLYQIKN